MNATVQKTFANLVHHHRDGATSRAEMALNPAGETLLLRGTQHMQIHDAAGWTVKALAGSVWITQDGDIRDVVLEAGESLTLDRKGPALLSPLGEAKLCVARDAGRCKVQRIAPAPGVTLAAARAAFA